MISLDFIGPPELLHINFAKKEYDFTEQIGLPQDFLGPPELLHTNFTKKEYDCIEQGLPQDFLGPPELLNINSYKNEDVSTEKNEQLNNYLKNSDTNLQNIQ